MKLIVLSSIFSNFVARNINNEKHIKNEKRTEH